MRFLQTPTLRVEDYPSEQSWIGKLFVQINPVLQSLYQVLNQNIDFSVNIMSITQNYDMTVTTFQAFKFQWPFPNSKPIDLRVIKALKGTTLTPTILLPAWSYDASTTTITVTQILEVTSSGIAQMSGRYQYSVRATV